MQINHQEQFCETWEESQQYELNFWINEWSYRHLSRPELVDIRYEDAKWFLNSFLIEEVNPYVFQGFEGTVLEVGCGPIGFFEKVKNITIKAIDPLMNLYSKNLPFSIIGKKNNCEYSEENIENIQDKYDFVVCSNVLDHTGDWEFFLFHLIKAIKPNTGQLLLYTHCRYAPSSGHTQVFDPADLVSFLLKLGVSDIKFMKIQPDISEHANYECYIRCSTSLEMPQIGVTETATTNQNENYIKGLWETGKKHELDFWRSWLDTKGLKWSEEYKNRQNPERPLQDYVTKYLSLRETVSVLDVGAGPLTILGKCWSGHTVHITAVDALANEYNHLLKEFDITPLVRTELCEAERLLERFPTNHFDLVHVCNALDHSYDPLLGLLQMLAVVKPGHYVLVQGAVNEGETAQYQGFHQWNFEVNNGDFLIWNHQIRFSVNDVLSEVCQINATQNEGWLFVEMKKAEAVSVREVNAVIKGLIELRQIGESQFQSSSVQLQQTQIELQQLLESQIQGLTTQLQQNQGELERSQTLIQAMESQLHQNQGNLERLQTLVEAMESSKFWKLRKLWFRLKGVMGLTRSSDLIP